ncbi:diguanylate cyclase [Novosphingobium sp. KCTC 2891]|uniref:GGDEF domain-containing protein n=1 Tax=Novosphingobium sp. KCTC 2891 TaxID=2989730 RepID=UPI002221BC44|nr:diguanylate cyclase [Novosphingobium sp. KCTC 2891]MCW1384182.1 diguanylate cyclase [Novosphingobium sp. KCTC 2891]
MDFVRSYRPAIVTALLYFAGVVYSVHYSRFEGGVAMIWISGAVLAASLVVMARPQRCATILACVAANTVGTGLFGLGWAPAFPLALVNVGEAAAAAMVLRRLIEAHWPRETLELVAGYYLGLGVIVPLAGATAGSAIASLIAGIDFERNFYHWLIGHAVGLLTVAPFSLVAARSFASRRPMISRETATTRLLLVATMALLTFGVFTQPIRPLMLLPLVFAMFAAVWSSAAVAMALPVVLATVGGTLTLRGLGPLAGMNLSPGDRVQVFELYAAFTTLCALPIICEQERRRRQVSDLARSEARYRLLSDDLSRAALTDPLTGLPNRRAFSAALDQLAGQADRACVALVDIDRFKSVNDRYGHLVGDEVLAAFAAIAESALGGEGTLARIGGEEFAILLPDCTTREAEAVCGTLSRCIAGTPIASRAGPVSITVSAGIAPLDGDIDDALAAADAALYRAKAQGRARYAVAA